MPAPPRPRRRRPPRARRRCTRVDPGRLQAPPTFGRRPHRPSSARSRRSAPRGRESRRSASATGKGAEFHRPAPSDRSGFLRSAATISPMIETAISAGLTAPMSRPIGAWMRASAASSKPSRAHPLEPSRVRLPRAERADVEALGFGARRRARGRRSSDRGSAGRSRCSGRAARLQAPRPAIARGPASRETRSGVAKAVRGSMIMTSRPAMRAIGASACEICTAPIITRRAAGTWTVRK